MPPTVKETSLLTVTCARAQGKLLNHKATDATVRASAHTSKNACCSIAHVILAPPCCGNCARPSLKQCCVVKGRGDRKVCSWTSYLNVTNLYEAHLPNSGTTADPAGPSGDSIQAYQDSRQDSN